MEKEIFAIATRKGVRFETGTIALLSVEDLWNLPLKSTVGRVNLDDVVKILNKKIASNIEESFIDELKSNIVKHIIKIKREENLIKLNKRR